MFFVLDSSYPSSSFGCSKGAGTENFWFALGAEYVFSPSRGRLPPLHVLSQLELVLRLFIYFIVLFFLFLGLHTQQRTLPTLDKLGLRLTNESSARKSTLPKTELCVFIVLWRERTRNEAWTNIHQTGELRRFEWIWARSEWRIHELIAMRKTLRKKRGSRHIKFKHTMNSR